MTRTIVIIDLDTPIVSAASVCQYNYKAYVDGVFRGRWVSQENFFDQAVKEMDENGDPVRFVKGEEGVEFEKIAEVIDDLGFDIISRGKSAIKASIQNIVRATGADEFVALVQGPNNFRYDVATIQEYKGNRPPKPLLVNDLKEWVMKAFPLNAIRSDGEESDDIISRYGWEAWANRNNPDHPTTILAHIDKDIDQVPGRHYNFNKKEFYDITPEEGCYNFLLSVLEGDRSDNIPGLQELPHHPDCDKSVGQLLGVSKTKKTAVGKKTAQNLLAIGKTPFEWWCIVVWCYKAQYGDKWLDVLTENCQLLYLRRRENEMYDVESVLKRMELL